jgi:hypothetical protein
MRILLLLLAASCGGNAVIDEAGGGSTTSSTTGGGGAGASPGTTTSGMTTSGPTGCDDHADCPTGVCIFSTGTCAQSCEFENACDSCGPGQVCDSCATSSCPDCRDCKSACVATPEGRCDDDDPCGDGGVCVFHERLCYPACGPDGDCGDFAFCEECVSGSCCGCLDCVSACVGGR